MDKELYKNGLSMILPDHDEQDENYEYSEQRENVLNEAVRETEEKLNASALARMKLREKRELEKLERRKQDPTYAMTPKQKEKYEKELQRINENIAEIEIVEASPEAQNFLSQGASDLTPYSGTTPREVAKLLTSLNINLNLNLTKNDTYNLLGCLLTCNESQLNALLVNTKVPIAIKTVIKRLLEDSKLGNIETVEKLWNRIFGTSKTAAFDMPISSTIPGVPGIIPQTVVSREAYTIIRDTVIGK